MDKTTLCESCGNEAIARLHREWLCARCGLARTTIATGPGAATDRATAGSARRWQRALRAAIGSGLAAKLLIGAAALAAVGGAIITNPPPDVSPPLTLSPETTPVGPPTSPVPDDLPPTANQDAVDATTPGVVPKNQVNAGNAQERSSGATPDNVAEYLAAIREWNACVGGPVDDFVIDRPGTRDRFNPFSTCSGRPQPADYGLAAALGPTDGARKPPDPGSQRNELPGQPADPGPPDSPGSQANLPVSLDR